jgi:type III secretory pathway component EscR
MINLIRQATWIAKLFRIKQNIKFYSIAVIITFYLLRPLKLTNQNQSQIQSVQLFITFAT